MYNFDKKLAQKEQLTPKFTYKVHVFPLTQEGKDVFRPPFKSSKGEITLEYTYYYDDPQEPEEERLSFISSWVGDILGHMRVPGFNPKSNTFNTRPSLIGLSKALIKYKKDWDYSVEKIVHEEPEILSEKDIRALK